MIRRIAATLACLLLAAAAFLALQFPLTAYAQNAGEAPSPKPDKESTSSEKQESSSTDEQEPAGGENNPDKQAEPEEPRDQPSGDGQDGGSSEDGTADDEAAGTDQTAGATGSEAGNVAEGSADGTGEAEDEETAGGTDVETQPVGPPAPPVDDQQQPEPPAPQGPAAPPISSGEQDTEDAADGPQERPNAVDTRPAGTSLANTAESGVDEDGVAIPPDPEFLLPNIPPPPASVAGSPEDYVEPSISLDVPGIREVPEGSDPGSYYQPDRDYLGERPLPPLDVDETEEERISRNIEESLRMLDLSAEERPTAGIQIPLPSGVVTFKASDSFSFDRQNMILTFRGNAEIIFEDIAIWADLIEVNDGAATAYASGYVAVQNKDEIIYADEAYLNYDTQILELFYVEGNTGGPRINGTLYFTADRAHGTFDHLILEHAEITTCEPFCGSVDEFHMSARKAVYKRNKSIVLHDIHPYVRSHKIGWLPILAFPLQKELEYQEEESEVSQTYGYNRSEGWFAKFAYTYSVQYAENVTRALLGVAKIDLTEKKGPGLGLRQDFLIPSMGVGTVRAFYQEEWPWEVATFADGTSADPQQNTNFEYSQELNLSRSLTGDMSITRDNTFVPARTINGNDRRTNTWRNRFTLNYRRNKTNASLTATQNINIQGGFTQSDGTQEPRRETVTTNANFRFNRDLSKELKLAVSEQYTASKGAAGRENLPADQEGTFQVDLNWTGERETSAEGYTAKLTYLERGIDFDGDSNTTDRNIQVRKELPSLQVTLPRDLINDGAYFTTFRVNLDNLVTGRRSRPESSLRGTIDVGGQDSIQFSGASRLSSNSSLEQYWYDDGNAQYVVQQSLRYGYDTRDWMQFDAGWNITYRQGVREPPVQGDRRTYQQRTNYGFTFSNRRSWRWRLSSGFDLTSWRHNPVSSRFEWDPNRTFGVTNTFSYDIRNRRFQPLHTVAGLRSPYIDPKGYYNWIVNVTLDTDIEKNFRTSRFDLKWAKRFKRGWSTEVTGSFRDNRDAPIDLSEDFVKDFVKKIVVRKVNCCTTIEGGWRTGINEVYINVFLNALPQYPGTADFRRPLDDDFSSDFLFPVNSLQQDILRDQFGIQQRLF